MDGEHDLPTFFKPAISGMMALREKGRTDEKEPVYSQLAGKEAGH